MWRIEALLARRGSVLLLVALTGVLWALASPHWQFPLTWPLVFVPLLLALDRVLRKAPARGFGRWLRVLGCTWPAGILFATLTGEWVTNTAFVYGQLPWPLAFGVNALGYGTLHGLELFWLIGVPFTLAWPHPLRAAALTTLWATTFQLFLPRFLFWTYGQLMLPAIALVQFADVLGSGGLNLLYLPLQFLLYAVLRARMFPAEVDPRAMTRAAMALGLGFLAAHAYGSWRLSALDEPALGAPVRSVMLVGIQPNFSLAALASNPALAHSDREASLDALLSDSTAALAGLNRDPALPVLVLWPESVYPVPYFYFPAERGRVEAWVREQGVNLVLATTDMRLMGAPGQRIRREVFGAAVHVAPDGHARGVYHKIVLIPWGETIPLADVIPGYRELLLNWIPQISEFTAGKEHTVFQMASPAEEKNPIGVAPMICFDASVESVARGMAGNGARVGVVLANLAWFGRTSVADQFAWFARFRAIENRMPIVFLSQNGESLLLDPAGRETMPRLEQFTHGAFIARVNVPPDTRLYTRFGQWVNRGFLVALLGLLAWMWHARRTRRTPM